MSKFLDDPEGHACGLVTVVEMTGIDGEILSKLVEINRKGARIQENLPATVRGQHVCCDNPHMRTVMAFYDRLMSRNTLLRMRHHYGKCPSA